MSANFEKQEAREIFSRHLDPSMDPRKISIRECRDSQNNPETIPLIMGLDVTGSMGTIPERLIKGELNKIMSHLMSEFPGLSFSVLFIAVGDLFSDKAPLQIGQFENDDEKIYHWLKTTWLEGGGGGNGGESYHLPWYFAAQAVVSDHWEKRHKKGIIITIGDEPIHAIGPDNGKVTHGDIELLSPEEAYKKASEKFHIHHVNCNFSRHLDPKAHNRWTDFVGVSNLHFANSEQEVHERLMEIIRSSVETKVASESAEKVSDIPQML